MSGGPDSLALLLLAHAALPGRVAAATIDHGLRPEAAEEAAMVAHLCARLGVPHDTVAVTLEPGNTQDRARDARYAALRRCFRARGIATFATAHHADDQAETLLMRLARGSGVTGLAGIRARTIMRGTEAEGDSVVVRPLLDWRRAELAAIVAQAGIAPAHDPGNDDERFDRIRARRLLGRAGWLDARMVARSAAHLQEAEEAIADVARSLYRSHVHEEGEVRWFHPGHARAIEIECVGLILHAFGADPGRSSIARMIDQLRGEGSASLGGVMARRASRAAGSDVCADAWKFEREPPRRSG